MGAKLWRSATSWETDSQIHSMSVGAEDTTDSTTSSDCADLLTRISPETQSLCVASSDNEVSLITLKLEVTKDMSLRALVGCGESNDFVRRQLLDNSKLKFIEREIPPTRKTVRLATGASVTVMKRVVEITYTLKEVQYDDDFIALDLDDEFHVILGLPRLRRYKATSQLASTKFRYSRLLFTRRPSDERLEASTTI